MVCLDCGTNPNVGKDEKPPKQVELVPTAAGFLLDVADGLVR